MIVIATKQIINKASCLQINSIGKPINKLRIVPPPKAVVNPKKYKPNIRAEIYPDITLSEKEEIIGVHNNPIQCKLTLSFVKELTKYKMLNVNDFDPSKHRYRDIVYLKDEIVKRSFNVDKK